MRKWLRFTITLENFETPSFDWELFPKKWYTYQRLPGDALTILCHLDRALNDPREGLLAHLKQIVWADSPCGLFEKFKEGIAWIISKPVHQWYHTVDDEVKGAFSGWTEHIMFFQYKHMTEAGPGVTCAYWVCL